MLDAIIPARNHRIPLELRSKTCLGESSTRMGDLLGSPRVASLFLWYFSIISDNSMFFLGLPPYTTRRSYHLLYPPQQNNTTGTPRCIGKRAGMDVVP